MTWPAHLVSLAIAAALLALPATATSTEFDSEQVAAKFLRQFRAAYAVRDVEAVLTLVHWRGLDLEHQDLIHTAMAALFSGQAPILDVQIVDASPERQHRTSFESFGVQYRYNLRAEKRLEITLDVPRESYATRRIVHHLGRVGDEYRIQWFSPAERTCVPAPRASGVPEHRADP